MIRPYCCGLPQKFSDTYEPKIDTKGTGFVVVGEKRLCKKGLGCGHPDSPFVDISTIDLYEDRPMSFKQEVY